MGSCETLLLTSPNINGRYIIITTYRVNHHNHRTYSPGLGRNIIQSVFCVTFVIFFTTVASLGFVRPWITKMHARREKEKKEEGVARIGDWSRFSLWKPMLLQSRLRVVCDCWRWRGSGYRAEREREKDCKRLKLIKGCEAGKISWSICM